MYLKLEITYIFKRTLLDVYLVSPLINDVLYFGKLN